MNSYTVRSFKVNRDLWREFKIVCIQLEREMSDCFNEALETYLAKLHDKTSKQPILQKVIHV
ncbi:MAG: hypothetical protein UT24_C0024G0010 [Candidatus Woesebacteria bacterium GW2011_GWB1_39_12]|uniref:Ribbon-helix-helix domain-containing protein n=1 Tax=Candidatus Woesebacteria bacterium GW2011_GWB1_39_12 TaxID=1618574 RepID=A0A0G0MG70_9BACT|nr:MAG: hypothetical protein UT24_C0024G0010 [Candidatus Woesebacteria bacterium GW2011_GWB1_39_12]